MATAKADKNFEHAWAMRKKGRSAEEALAWLEKKIPDPAALPAALRADFARLQYEGGRRNEALESALAVLASPEAGKAGDETRAFLEENLTGFRDAATALDACWRHHARAGDWDGARKVLRHAALNAPETIAEFRCSVLARQSSESTAQITHGALAQIALAERQGGEAVQYLRSALHGPPALAAFAGKALDQLARSNPDHLDTRWALLEAGRLSDEGWIDKAMELAAQEPARMVLYLKDAVPRSSASSREELRKLASEMTVRFPELPGAWEALAEYLADDPRAEAEVRARVVRIDPESDAARHAMARIHELGDGASGDLNLQFIRVKALLWSSEWNEARAELEPLARVDPSGSLDLLAEARAAGVPLPEDYLLLDAACYHRTGRDVEAAERIREATGTPVLVRSEALAELRTDSPYSPDLACALAEVCLQAEDPGRAETVLLGLLEQAPGTAPAILAWLEGETSFEAPALCARAELLADRQEAAVERIARLVAEGDDRGRELVGLAAEKRIAGTADVTLDLEVLRLLVETGHDPHRTLRLVSRLESEGAADRVLAVIGDRVPGDESTEDEWLGTLARLNAGLGRTGTAVAVARTGSTEEKRLRTLDALLEQVPPGDRWAVLEGRAEVLLAAEGESGDILDLLERLLDEHPRRTEAAQQLLDRCPRTEETEARHLMLRGRCEARSGRHDTSAETFLAAARTAAESGNQGVVAESARRLGTLVTENGELVAPRLCLSKVGSLQGDVEAALGPIRDTLEITTPLLERLDEIHDEFPGRYEALWTSVDWHRNLGSHAEAVRRLERLLQASIENAEDVRAQAEEIHTESGLVPALFVAADVDRRRNEADSELDVLRRILDRDPDAWPEVRERLGEICSLHPRGAGYRAAAMDLAVRSGDAEGLLGFGTEALRAPIADADATAVAEALGRGRDLEGAAESDSYWALLADHWIRARNGPEAVEACRRLSDLVPHAENGVESRLVALRNEGILPPGGVDLLIDRYRVRLRAADLAQAIRWRREGDADEGVVQRLREAGEEVYADQPVVALAAVLEELCLAQGDAGGALEYLLHQVEGLGPEKALERFARLEDRFPDESGVPLERAVRVYALQGRAREAALDLEQVLAVDPDAAVDRGLPYVRGLLDDHGDEPELLRVLARLCIGHGESLEALEHLNRLVAAGESYRPRALELLAELVDRYPTMAEARLRWAEVLADAARSERAPERARDLWKFCDERCRECLGRALSPEDELRAAKLLATSLEGRTEFEEASKVLLTWGERYPEDAELRARVRSNHLKHMEDVAGGEGDEPERAAAHLRAGRPDRALAILPSGDEEAPTAASLRAWAHYARRNHDRVVKLAEPFLGELPPGGSLDPPYHELLYFAGRSCIATGDEARGISFLERLARDRPCHRACRAFLEEHYRRREAGEARDIELTSALEELGNGQA